MRRYAPLAFLIACTDSPCDLGTPLDTSGDTSGDTSAADDTGFGGGICVSGTEWTRDDEGSSKMNPGEACIDCHESEREAPDFEVGGTVYSLYDEPNDCDGLENAIVRLLGADGTSFEIKSNAAGNFLMDSSRNTLVMPYTAEVEFPDGSVAAMVSPQESGDCNGCHSQSGTEGAPGRIAQVAGK